MYNIDIKIMAVKSRRLYAEYVLEYVKENPTAKICYDPYGYNGSGNPWLNARRIWSMKPADGCEYKLVLQDDIDLVNDFLYYVEKCIAFQPDAVWAYFLGMSGEKSIKDNRKTPFVKVKGCLLSGQAILMPVKYIAKMIDDTDRVFGSTYKNDDVRIGWWCAMNRISVFTTNPTIVKHRTIKTTVRNHNAMRTTRKWRGKDIKGLNINWNAKTYTLTPLLFPYMWIDKTDENQPIDRIVEYCDMAKQIQKQIYKG